MTTQPLHDRDSDRRVIQHLETQVSRLFSAEAALHRLTDVLGITVEPDADGRYDLAALRAQAQDAIEQRAVEQGLNVSPSPAILTASGWPMSLTFPTWRCIDDQDIAQALSRICRFCGHSRQFYSVAQHCVHVSEIVPREDALAALLHDATEAYIGDLVSPLKSMLPAYKAIEQRLWSAIAQRFSVDPVLPASVKQADLQLLAIERRDLLPDSPMEWPCLENIEPLEDPIEPWSPDIASLAWGLRLEELLAEREVA